MGLFGGGASAPDLRPYLDIMKKSVNNAEGKMSQYDTVIDDFANMGLDKYNSSVDLFGPWQESLNTIYQQTTASSYASDKNQNMSSQLRQFNRRAEDKFLAAGVPMGPSVGKQRGLSQDIMQAEYAAQNDFSAKHEVAQLHQGAMERGDQATQNSFNQMAAGVNMQQGVSDMYASNAANQQSSAMSQAGTAGYVGSSNNALSAQADQNMWSSIGTLGGIGVAYGMGAYDQPLGGKEVSQFYSGPYGGTGAGAQYGPTQPYQGNFRY